MSNQQNPPLRLLKNGRKRATKKFGNYLGQHQGGKGTEEDEQKNNNRGEPKSRAPAGPIHGNGANTPDSDPNYAISRRGGDGTEAKEEEQTQGINTSENEKRSRVGNWEQEQIGSIK